VADALFDEALAEAAGALGAALGARSLDPAAEAAARDVLAGVVERADRRRMQAGLPSLGFDGREALAQRVFDELQELAVETCGEELLCRDRLVEFERPIVALSKHPCYEGQSEQSRFRIFAR